MKLTKTLALVGMLSLASIKAGKGMDPVAEEMTWQQKHMYIKQFVSEKFDVETAWKYSRMTRSMHAKEFVECVFENLFEITDYPEQFLKFIKEMNSNVQMKWLQKFHKQRRQDELSTREKIIEKLTQGKK